jgi:sporulation protein YlmC with PRC-barrel domain
MIRTFLTTAATAAALAVTPAVAAEMDDGSAAMSGDGQQTQAERQSMDEQNPAVGAGSDLEGARYGDLEGRSVFTNDETELGSVANARVTPQGAIDALILKDAGNFGLNEQYVMVPVERISASEGGEADLVVDVTDAEIRSMVERRMEQGEGQTGQ